MATYRIFVPSGKSTEQAVLVREGFSVAAAVFSVVWALWNRMWIIAPVIFAGLAAIAVLGGVFKVSDELLLAAQLAIGIVLGFEAENLRSWKLVRAGYRETGIVMGGNIEEAELKYFLASPSSSTNQGGKVSRPRSGSAHDTLGLFGTA